ncbi:hypothetical protein IAU59_006387 [Kwoniella sp. CBS 9459]
MSSVSTLPGAPRTQGLSTPTIPSGISSDDTASSDPRYTSGIRNPTAAAVPHVGPQSQNDTSTVTSAGTRPTKLSVLNLDAFIARHQDEGTEPAWRKSVLETLIRGSSTVELPVSEADELDSHSQKLSELLATVNEKERNEALQKRVRGLLGLSMATNFLDEEVRSKLMGSNGGSGNSVRADPAGDSVRPGHKMAQITLLNLDSFLPLSHVLKTNEDSKVQSAVSAILTGTPFRTEMPDHIAELLLNKHKERVKELESLKDTKGEKEAEKWFGDLRSNMEVMRQDWLGERLAPSDIPWDPPLKADIATGATESKTSQAKEEDPSATSDPASEPEAVRTDLVDTEINFKNFDTFLNAYWTSNNVCSEATTDYLFEKYHPMRNRKILLEIAGIWESAGQSAARVTIPSDLASALKKREEDVATWLTEDTQTQAGVEKSVKWRLGDLFHKWKKWKDTYKWKDSQKLSASTTSVPNITRRPISQYTATIDTLDEKQVKEIVDYVLDPSVTEISDDEFLLAREAFKRSDGGFGKQGLQPEHLDALHRKRKLTWDDLEVSDNYKMLRTAFEGSSGGRGAGTTTSAEDIPVAAPTA